MTNHLDAIITIVIFLFIGLFVFIGVSIDLNRPPVVERCTSYCENQGTILVSFTKEAGDLECTCAPK